MTLHCPRPNCGGRVWDEDGRILCSLCSTVYADPVTSGTVVLPPLGDDYVAAVKASVLADLDANPMPADVPPRLKRGRRPRLVVCTRGHDAWTVLASGKRECLECRRGYKRDWRRAKGAG